MTTNEPDIPPPLPGGEPSDARESSERVVVHVSRTSVQIASEEPSRDAGLLVKVLGTLGVLLFIAVVPLGAASMPWIVSKARGYHDVVLEPLQTCQVALDALGENPRFSPFGNNSGGRQSGLISWSATVRGSEARGTYRYSLRGSRDAWELVSATLIVDGHVHRLMHCARADGR